MQKYVKRNTYIPESKSFCCRGKCIPLTDVAIAQLADIPSALSSIL